MKNKLTTLEKRAEKFCAELAKRGEATLVIKWRRRYEGWQAVAIDGNGQTMASTSGGGYCKESQCLADVLRFLNQGIWHAGGAGFCEVQSRMHAAGYDMTPLTSSARYNVYSIKKISR